MNCCKVQSLLSAYIDRELTGRESLAIRDHVACCQPCCSEYESILRVKQLAGRLSTVEPKDELLAQIQAAVSVAEQQRRFQFKPSNLVIAMAAGAAIAFATFTFQARAEMKYAETENQTPTGDVYAGGIDAVGGYRPSSVVRYGE